jgi:predicted AlkP superfamily phosphohydrolase/phosphomutase
VFGATHRIGHYLWDLSQLDANTLNASQADALAAALLRVYQATDHAIARVLEQVGADTLVVVFAVHGMGPNPGWSDLAPDILDAAARSASGRAPKTGLLYALRRHLPFQLVRPILRRLPLEITDRLVSIWSARMYDWRSTRHFPVPMDHAGYLRVNLRGRERAGIVEAGSAYDEACNAVEKVFLGLRDRDSSRQIAPQIMRAYANAPSTAPYRDLIPDLIVPWQGPSATQSRELYCDALRPSISMSHSACRRAAPAITLTAAGSSRQARGQISTCKWMATTFSIWHQRCCVIWTPSRCLNSRGGPYHCAQARMHDH